MTTRTRDAVLRRAAVAGSGRRVTEPAPVPRRARGGGAADARKAALLAAALACAPSVSWSASAGSSYLAVWSSDKGKDANRSGTDFLAIIDADPRSSTYGKVVNTASLERVAGANLLNDLASIIHER